MQNIKMQNIKKQNEQNMDVISKTSIKRRPPGYVEEYDDQGNRLDRRAVYSEIQRGVPVPERLPNTTSLLSRMEDGDFIVITTHPSQMTKERARLYLSARALGCGIVMRLQADNKLQVWRVAKARIDLRADQAQAQAQAQAAKKLDPAQAVGSKSKYRGVKITVQQA